MSTQQTMPKQAPRLTAERLQAFVLGDVGKSSSIELSYMAEEVLTLRNSHEKLVALVVRYAGECAECGGRGAFSEHREDPGGHSVLECWECADIRAALQVSK